MTVKQQLIAEIEEIDNPITLVQLFEIMQLIKQNAGKRNTLISRFAGCLNDADAQEMRGIVDNEFNKIEGEW
ncbi:MAG: hypothetical protein NTV43_10870 [Methylococcales bacterium]|nr:hypothetical protein [Methylococcales bacterium]